MSIMEADPPFTTPLESEPTLKFYAGLDVRTSGCVILQADDKAKYCVFAPSSLLNGLSSFFRDLPPPSEADLICGIPLIPLFNATTEGLAVYVKAIQSISQSEPFHFPRPRYPSDHAVAVGILEAAAIARRYDTPIVFRLLIEAVRTSPEFEGSESERHIMEFAVWAIGGVESQLQAAAAASLGTRITWLSSPLFASLALHAPHHFIKLQALNLRRHEAPFNFSKLYHDCTCAACHLNYGETQNFAISERFEDARTTEELWAVAKGNFGLECEDCIRKAGASYHRDLEWLRRFTTEYGFDERAPY